MWCARAPLRPTLGLGWGPELRKSSGSPHSVPPHPPPSSPPPPPPPLPQPQGRGGRGLSSLGGDARAPITGTASPARDARSCVSSGRPRYAAPEPERPCGCGGHAAPSAGVRRPSRRGAAQVSKRLRRRSVARARSFGLSLTPPCDGRLSWALSTLYEGTPCQWPSSSSLVLPTNEELTTHYYHESS